MPKPRPKRSPDATQAVTLKIPKKLFDNLAQLIEGTGFRSVTEFAIHVLRDVAAGGKLGAERPSGLSDRDLDAVHQRLRALGYIE